MHRGVKNVVFRMKTDLIEINCRFYDYKEQVSNQ